MVRERERKLWSTSILRHKCSCQVHPVCFAVCVCVSSYRRSWGNSVIPSLDPRLEIEKLYLVLLKTIPCFHFHPDRLTLERAFLLSMVLREDGKDYSSLIPLRLFCTIRSVLKTGSNIISRNNNVLIYTVLFFLKIDLDRMVDQFQGTWKSISCENFEDYMKELGESRLLTQ